MSAISGSLYFNFSIIKLMRCIAYWEEESKPRSLIRKKERELAMPVFMLCPIQLTLSFWRSQWLVSTPSSSVNRCVPDRRWMVRVHLASAARTEMMYTASSANDCHQSWAMDSVNDSYAAAETPGVRLRRADLRMLGNQECIGSWTLICIFNLL